MKLPYETEREKAEFFDEIEFFECEKHLKKCEKHRRSSTKESILEEFLRATPEWLEALKNLQEISGKDCCLVCGAKYENFKKLFEYIPKYGEEKYQEGWKAGYNEGLDDKKGTDI